MIILYILTEVHSGNTRRRAFFQNIFRLEPEWDQAPPPPCNITWSCHEHNLDNHHHWHKDKKDRTESRMMKGLLLPRAELQRSERLEQGWVIENIWRSLWSQPTFPWLVWGRSRRGGRDTRSGSCDADSPGYRDHVGELTLMTMLMLTKMMMMPTPISSSVGETKAVSAA